MDKSVEVTPKVVAEPLGAPAASTSWQHDDAARRGGGPQETASTNKSAHLSGLSDTELRRHWARGLGLDHLSDKEVSILLDPHVASGPGTDAILAAKLAGSPAELQALVQSNPLSKEQVMICAEALGNELKSLVLNTVVGQAQMMKGSEGRFVLPDPSTVERIWRACNARLAAVRMSEELVAALVDKLYQRLKKRGERNSELERLSLHRGINIVAIWSLVHTALFDERARLRFVSMVLGQERHPLTRVVVLHIREELQNPGSIYRNARLHEARGTAASSREEDCGDRLCHCLCHALCHHLCHALCNFQLK